MSIRLLDIQLLIANPVMSRDEHRHDFVELIAPVRPGYTAWTVGEDLTVAPGELVVYPPGLRHRPTYRRDGELSFLLLQWYDDEPPVRELALFKDAGGFVGTALQWLWSTRLQRPRPRRLQRSLLQAVRQQLGQLADPPDHPMPEPADPIERAVGWLQRHFTTNVDLDQLAGVAGMARSTFTRRFKQSQGVTPLAMITTFRLRQACQALLACHGDVAAAGRLAGFQSTSNFRRAFRRFYGCAPLQWYRRQPAAVRA